MQFSSISRCAVLSLLLFLGCKPSDETIKPTISKSGDSEGGQRLRLSPMSLNFEGDPIEVWIPKSSIPLSMAASTFADAMRSEKGDQKRAQRLYVEAGHMVRDYLQTNPKFQLDQEDRFFVAEVVYQQAKALTDTKHALDGIDALKAAIGFGFHDVDRIQSHFPQLQAEHASTYEELLAAAESIQEREIDAKVDFASNRFTPFGIVLQNLTVVSNPEPQPHPTGWKLYYCTGTSYMSGHKMLEALSRIKSDFPDVQFIVISFESRENRSNPNFIRSNMLSVELPVYAGNSSHFLAFRTLAGMPAVVMVDPDGIVRASIEGYQPMSVVRKLLKELIESDSL